MKYRLDNNVRILQLGTSIYFRKGLWNFNEASLDLAEFDEGVQQELVNLVNELWMGNSVDDEKFANSPNKQKLDEFISGLNYGGFIQKEGEAELREKVLSALLGNMSFQTKRRDPGKVLMVTDSDFVKKIATTVAEEIGLSVTFENDDMVIEIMKSDIVDRTDALSHKDKLNHYSEMYKEYDAVIVCTYRCNLAYLRNINEIVVKLNKHLIIGLVDGPFIHIAGLNPPRTADFDSLEQRMLSRLQDHQLYKMHSTMGVQLNNIDGKQYIPIMNTLVNLCLSEGYLVTNTGACKFDGRLLSIYIPTLEIQVQDILKISSSITMGNIAKSKYEDNQIVSSKLINELLSQRKRAEND